MKHATVVGLFFGVIASACGIALACNDPLGGATPFDGETPVIVGTITSRDPINGTPAMFVVEDGATSNDCYPHRAPFTLGSDVKVFQNGSPKDMSDLKVGRRVAVFAPVPTIKPCLPSAPARGVFLE
jgi:hypothetical protein